jgi:hypothetical protein
MSLVLRPAQDLGKHIFKPESAPNWQTPFESFLGLISGSVKTNSVCLSQDSLRVRFPMLTPVVLPPSVNSFTRLPGPTPAIFWIVENHSDGVHLTMV